MIISIKNYFLISAIVFGSEALSVSGRYRHRTLVTIPITPIISIGRPGALESYRRILTHCLLLEHNTYQQNHKRRNNTTKPSSDICYTHSKRPLQK